MKHHALTLEQDLVVHHALGQHAYILAVAESDEAITMAHRFK